MRSNSAPGRTTSDRGVARLLSCHIAQRQSCRCRLAAPRVTSGTAASLRRRREHRMRSRQGDRRPRCDHARTTARPSGPSKEERSRRSGTFWAVRGPSGPSGPRADRGGHRLVTQRVARRIRRARASFALRSCRADQAVATSGSSGGQIGPSPGRKSPSIGQWKIETKSRRDVRSSGARLSRPERANAAEVRRIRSLMERKKSLQLRPSGTARKACDDARSSVAAMRLRRCNRPAGEVCAMLRPALM